MKKTKKIVRNLETFLVTEYHIKKALKQNINININSYIYISRWGLGRLFTMGDNKMVMANLLSVIMLMHAIVALSSNVRGLSKNYYMKSCPTAEQIVKNSVNNALQADPTLAAGLIRMLFHDCFIEGCDASILLDSTNDNTAEKDSPGNLSLRGYEIIYDTKQEIENTCPGVVSCADILAMAARDAVFWAGGPFYQIPKGRFDGKRSKIEDTKNLLPPSFNASQLIQAFGQRGFSPKDVVALSGKFLFEILGAWRRILCAKQVISLVETMKLPLTTYMEVFWSMQRLVLQLTFKCPHKYVYEWI
ncbi:BnaCnng14900D [Brassica napus]|uniref:Peroxidase n=1 Tax=Brassica napus TaxID=3708 RepID=A0A078IDU1_BRANA|nr:BnaCnng14900D [Brassica napus]